MKESRRGKGQKKKRPPERRRGRLRTAQDARQQLTEITAAQKQARERKIHKEIDSIEKAKCASRTN